MRDRNPAIAIGGGLAGAAFALELARNGKPVVVLERSRQAHHKVCGEFVSEEAQDVLAAFGIDARALGALPISRFRLVKGGRCAANALPFAAVSLSRCRLDEALLVAAERAGAEVIRDVSVTQMSADESGINVRSAGHPWHASAVALATGKHSMRNLPRPKGRMVGFKMHLEPSAGVADALAGVVQLAFFRGGYAGASLIEDGILNIAWVMHGSLVRGTGTEWQAQSRFLAQQSDHVGDLLAGARPRLAKTMAVAGTPYGFLRDRPIAPGIFPVGDQIAVVPSFTGDGMAIALHSGLMAARAILAGQSAESYQRDFVGRLRRQFRIARHAGRVLETPATCAVAVEAARLMPALITGVAAATRLRGFKLPAVSSENRWP
jgi:menaquinone-9 beta-reductase